jgi:type IV secretion system protein VirB9
MTIRTLTLAVVLLASTAGPALASDSRLTQRLYSADEVVRIDGRLGVQATVAFADDEHIENVAVGDSESWQITPNKRANLLFVKPLAASARTNMTVVTDRHTYYFDLVANARATPVYALRFTYPPEPKMAATAASATALSDAEREVLNPEETPIDPARLNFAWAKKGEAKLLPSRLYDDGESTYAIWPRNVPIPAILVTNDRGDEGPVNFGVRGDTIVIDDVPSRIILRVGRDRAQLDYQGPSPNKTVAAIAAPQPASAPIAAADSNLPNSQ